MDRRPHGGGGARVRNASYFSSLLGDGIKRPGLDKLKAIAEAMGFPARLWLEDPERWGVPHGWGDLTFVEKEASFKDLLNELFASILDERTGEALTNGYGGGRSGYDPVSWRIDHDSPHRVLADIPDVT